MKRRTQQDDSLITVGEVAETLGYTERHIYTLIKDGVIPIVRIAPHGRPRVSRRFIEGFLAKAGGGQP